VDHDCIQIQLRPSVERDDQEESEDQKHVHVAPHVPVNPARPAVT
jgi:hypothetical protein